MNRARKRAHARRLRDQRGLTLLELLVVLVLGAGVAATAGWFQRQQFLAMENQAAQLDLQNTTRAIVDLFARDVRRAGMDPTCGKLVQALVSADATAFRFQADLNANGALDVASEDFTYRLVDTTRLERTQGTATEPLLEGVDLAGSRLRYFDAAGTEIVSGAGLTAAQRAVVRRVRIELSAGAPARTGSDAPRLTARAATDVELRNRFFVEGIGCS